MKYNQEGDTITVEMSSGEWERVNQVLVWAIGAAMHGDDERMLYKVTKLAIEMNATRLAFNKNLEEKL